MGMLLRRHYAVAKPVKPVEQTKAESVEEKPIEDEIQAVVAEVAEEPTGEIKEVPKAKPETKRSTATKRSTSKRTGGKLTRKK